MTETHDAIALHDMDGTLADFDGSMRQHLKEIQSPAEATIVDIAYSENHPFMSARRNMIKNLPGFWRNLPKVQLGFDVLDICRDLGFENHILTKGPGKIGAAWAEKFDWCREHVPDLSISMSQKKSLMYGKVLNDDWPPYFLPWLDVRPRGLVVCIAQRWNADVNHPRVIRYDGTNLEEVRERLIQVRATAKRYA